MEEITEQKSWFAMRATYRRELTAHRALGRQGIDSYVPMRRQLRLQGGRRRYGLVPAVRSLIFVHAEPRQLQLVKQRLPYLQYMMSRSGEKIVVPDSDMERFIAVSSKMDEELAYLSPDDACLERGLRVRILAGPFAGQEGRLAKVQGFRSRKVVVAIEGVAAIALTRVPSEEVEVIAD